MKFCSVLKPAVEREEVKTVARDEGEVKALAGLISIAGVRQRSAGELHCTRTHLQVILGIHLPLKQR
jgi:hypothetical protein